MSNRLRIADPNRPLGLEPIPFPRSEPRPVGDTGNDVLAAFDTVSRRMDDLARALDCLGFFDDGDDDRPRAA